MIDFACVSSTTPTWGNDPRWCTPGIAATEAEHNKMAANRASSAPVQGQTSGVPPAPSFFTWGTSPAEAKESADNEPG
eukprot:jgi/Tetstr1/429114/TSEL_019076.t1